MTGPPCPSSVHSAAQEDLPLRSPHAPLAASLSGLPCLDEHSGSIIVVQLPSRVCHFATPRTAARLPVLHNLLGFAQVHVH